MQLPCCRREFLQGLRGSAPLNTPSAAPRVLCGLPWRFAARRARLMFAIRGKRRKHWLGHGGGQNTVHPSPTQHPRRRRCSRHHNYRLAVGNLRLPGPLTVRRAGSGPPRRRHGQSSLPDSQHRATASRHQPHPGTRAECAVWIDTPSPLGPSPDAAPESAWGPVQHAPPQGQPAAPSHATFSSKAGNVCPFAPDRGEDPPTINCQGFFSCCSGPDKRR
jgi:hypothetical protein